MDFVRVLRRDYLRLHINRQELEIIIYGIASAIYNGDYTKEDENVASDMLKMLRKINEHMKKLEE